MLLYKPTELQFNTVIEAFQIITGLLAIKLKESIANKLAISESINEIQSDLSVILYYRCSGQIDVDKLIWHYLANKYNFFLWDDPGDIWKNIELIIIDTIGEEL